MISKFPSEHIPKRNILIRHIPRQSSQTMINVNQSLKEMKYKDIKSEKMTPNWIKQHTARRQVVPLLPLPEKKQSEISPYDGNYCYSSARRNIAEFSPSTMVSSRNQNNYDSIKADAVIFKRSASTKKEFDVMYKSYTNVKFSIERGKLTSRQYNSQITPAKIVGKFSHRHLNYEQISKLNTDGPKYRIVVLNYLLNSPDEPENKVQALQALIDRNQDEPKKIEFLKSLLLTQIEKIKKIDRLRSL